MTSDEDGVVLRRALEALRAPKGLLGGVETPQPPAPPPVQMPNDPQWALYLTTLDFIACNLESDPETALLLCAELKFRLERYRDGAMLADEVNTELNVVGLWAYRLAVCSALRAPGQEFSAGFLQ